MSANYTLTLSNPNVATMPSSVVYTNVAGGNTLDLILGNNFGFDLTIGGGSKATYLGVSISANILDATGANSLTVAAPWTIGGVQPPSGMEAAPPRFWTFRLMPPAGGITIPNGQSLTIALGNLAPSAVGTGLIKVFDDTPADSLQVAASLSSLAPPDSTHPPLIGDNDALRLTIYVNGGDLSNPIMVSAAPVTPDTAVENALRFNLSYQQAAAAAQTGDGPLVQKWDTAHPPALRLFFPYSTSSSDTLRAPFDLTDSLSPGEPGYNPITSAWNIKETLNPTCPNVTADTFWQIALDPDASAPMWLVTPTACNKHLFTAVESSPSEPGPFLDLYLESIVSGLTIDPESPETIVYIQWNDFPGFSDGVVAFPLRKSALAVNTFAATLRRTDLGPELILEWKTSGAAYCLVTGDSARQATVSQGDSAYRQTVTADSPLESAYTLTAVGADGVTTASRRVVSRWRLNEAVPPVPIDGAAAGFHALPDGRTVLLIVGNSVQAFDAETLRPRGGPPITLPGGAIVLAFAVSGDGTTLYAEGADGRAYSFDVESHEALPGAGADLQGTALAPYPVALSRRGERVAFVTRTTAGISHLEVLGAAGLQPVSGSPVRLPGVAAHLAAGGRSDRYYLGLDDGITVLDGAAYQPVPGSPVRLKGPFLIALSGDESSVYSVSWPGQPHPSVISKIDPATLQVQTQIPIDTFLFRAFPVGTLTTSVDGRLLFVAGLSRTAHTHGRTVSRLSAYDAQTLDEMPWSPVPFGPLLPFDVAMAPDGSRLFAVAVAESDDQGPSFQLYAVDPDFR